MDRNFDGRQRAVLLKPMHAMRPFEVFDNCLLDDRLAVANTVELRADGLHLDWELAVPRNPPSPIEGVRPVEKLAEVESLEGSDFHHHAIGRAQPQIGPRHGRQIPVENDTSVRNRLPVVTQVFQLARDDRFESKSCRRNQFDLVVQFVPGARPRPLFWHVDIWTRSSAIVKNDVLEEASGPSQPGLPGWTWRNARDI